MYGDSYFNFDLREMKLTKNKSVMAIYKNKNKYDESNVELKRSKYILYFKHKKKNLLSILYALRAVSICIFIFSPPSLFNSIIFGITFGLLWLSTVPPTNGIVAQIFGTKYLSTLFGIVFLCHQFGAFAGAFLGGYFYDLYGSYDYAWYIAIALSIFATIVHYPIDESRIVRVDNTI